MDCLTAAGAVTPYTSQLAHPVAITRGGDGALWYIDPAANKLARLVPGPCTAAPAITTFDLPLGTGAVDITSAPTGNDLFSRRPTVCCG